MTLVSNGGNFGPNGLAAVTIWIVRLKRHVDMPDATTLPRSRQQVDLHHLMELLVRRPHTIFIRQT